MATFPERLTGSELNALAGESMRSTQAPSQPAIVCSMRVLGHSNRSSCYINDINSLSSKSISLEKLMIANGDD